MNPNTTNTKKLTKIALSQGKYSTIDERDFRLVSQYKWTYGNGYAFRNDKGKRVYLHRFILKAPKGLEVDHINHNALDNRRVNLRICTHTENTHNLKAKGYSWQKDAKMWRVRIMNFGKTFQIGYFKSISKAKKAYKEASKKYHKQFSNL